MADLQPIESQSSKWPAREKCRTMNHEESDRGEGTESDSDPWYTPSERQVDRAMKTLAAAFGPGLKITKEKPERPKQKGRRGEGQRSTHPRATDARASPPAHLRTPGTPRLRSPRPHTPDRADWGSYLQPSPEPQYRQDLHSGEAAAGRRPPEHTWTPKSEAEAYPTGRGLYSGAAMNRSFLGDGRAEMDFAHALFRLEEEKRKKLQSGTFKLPASVPMPYCCYRHIRNHGQQPAVSNFTNSAGNLPVDFPKLRMDGGNILEWSQQLQVVFLKENMSHFINDPPERPWTLELDCMHHRAFYLLIASISPTIYHCIGHNLTVSEIIGKMFGLFYSESVSTTTQISKDFFSARLKPGTPMSEHLVSLSGTRAELHLRGEVISDQIMKSVIINSLDHSWNNFLTHLDTVSLGMLSVEKLSNKLIAEDNLRRSRPGPPREHKSEKRVVFQEKQHNTPECYICGSRGHIKRDCPKNYRERGRPEHRYRQTERHTSEERYRRRDSPVPRDKRGNRDSSRDSRTGSLYGIGEHTHTTHQDKDTSSWLLDSGASNHTTYNQKLLSSFKREDFSIKVADQNQVRVTGKGTITLPGVGKIEGVLLVPEIPHNILAAVKLSKESGVEMIFTKGNVKVSKDRKDIGRVTINQGLPYITFYEDYTHSINTSSENAEDTDQGRTEGEQVGGKEVDNDSNTTPKTQHNKHTQKRPSIGKPMHDNCAHLLHRKLGHASFPVIQKMANCTEGAIIKNCENYLECSVCKCSKLKVKPRPKKSLRAANQIFDLVHMDLCSPVSKVFSNPGEPSEKGLLGSAILALEKPMDEHGFISGLLLAPSSRQKVELCPRRKDGRGRGNLETARGIGYNAASSVKEAQMLQSKLDYQAGFSDKRAGLKWIGGLVLQGVGERPSGFLNLAAATACRGQQARRCIGKEGEEEGSVASWPPEATGRKEPPSLPLSR
ncbi:uncharacterized protein LOC132712237 [Pantherophis guttatus]|uniref:Uncharacterized protein LOC132712237 n=1 Tax=Pantherophis guttatus TaxID=94885 RepID=A0ABM3ZL18_PANGU|nr:uncharacterized protein LOC132712237 [Pantherophis guttatus]